MTIQSGKQYHTDQVHYLRKTVVFGDDGVTQSLGWLPSGAVIIDAGAVVSTAFDSGTSDVLDIGFRNAGDGTTTDADDMATDVDISSVGLKAADELATATDLMFPSGAEITADYVSGGTAPTAGSAVVFVTYLADNT